MKIDSLQVLIPWIAASLPMFTLHPAAAASGPNGGAATGAVAELAPGAFAGALGLPSAGMPWAPPPLRINEVGIGGLEYVELFNGGSSALSLSGCRLTTGSGTISFADVTQLIPAGGYYVLARTGPADVGVSNDPSVPLKTVSVPLTGLLSDTVLLETSAGAVIDAVAYGSSAPLGALYSKALAAGQFTSGQFVSLANEYGSVALGRNAQGRDTNSLAADWTTHGGVDGYCGSPCAVNRGIPAGASETVKMVQARLNQVLMNVYGCDVTNASHVGASGSDGNSSAIHTLHVQSPTLGLLKLTGLLSYKFQGAAGGDYTIRLLGALQDAAAGVQLDVDVRDQKIGASQTLTLTVNLKNLTGALTQRPYSETVVLAGSGARGNHTLSQTRSLTDWFLITRSTAATQSIRWVLAGGVLQSVASDASIQRDWPIVPNVPGGTPNPPYTTERLTFASTCTPRDDGFDLKFGAFQSDFGSFGIADHRNAGLSVTVDDSGSHVSAVRVADVTYPSPAGFTTAMRIQTDLTIDPQSGNVASDTQLYDGPQLLGSLQGFIDPPAQGSGWKRLLGELVGHAKWLGHVAATVISGSACAVATSAVPASGYPVLPAPPATLPPITYMVFLPTTCAQLVNLVYEHTRPN